MTVRTDHGHVEVQRAEANGRCVVVVVSQDGSMPYHTPFVAAQCLTLKASRKLRRELKRAEKWARRAGRNAN